VEGRESGAERMVLVADDDADVRELIVFRLERAGYRVLTAGDGERAVELALAERPDICVIDVMMPKLDGYGVTERLRAAGELDGMPIMLLTASVEDAAVDRGFAAGADEYVKKPFSHRELLDRIERALERRG
jgi:two-component system, OmpR family, response regulator MtrA